MDKIKKMWVETHTKKNGESYYTGHMKRKWGILPYEEWITEYNGDFFMSDNAYFPVCEFETKQLAISHLQKLKNDELIKDMKENGEEIISIKKEYIN